MSEIGRPASLGDQQPGWNVAALMWRAMRGAATSSGARGTDSAISTSDDDIVDRLPALWEAVWRAAGGHEPALVAIPPPQARQLLDAVRRSFVDLVRSASQHCLEVREVVRVLDAIERVQAAIDRDVAMDFKERLEGPAGLDLVIEVAHDLRSPLTSILFLAETLRAGQSGPLKPIQERQLALIYSAAFELSSLANDLTELARGGEQLLERQPVGFSISNLLNSVRDIVRPIAEEKGLEVRVVRQGVDHRVGHPAALGRVLLNLVTNALKYTDEGLVEASAHDLSATRTEFTVRDSGPGMPTEVVSQLFEPFYPGVSAHERGFSSSGLGLAICRRLVTAMGGQLLVKTAPERGSCFYFALPLPADDPEQMLESTGAAGGYRDVDERHASDQTATHGS
ncbi:MAG: HAMP domain-containing histidine kinase [Gemmatimonadota bacterium]|nr:HAMP domain-containing histidine kinase [Gemmatimonadota bacterium]